MKKIITCYIIFMFVITGCTSINNVEQYMKPPTMDKDTEEVKNVIYAKLPGNAEFLYPIFGNIRNSIFFIDIDGNGSREAVVFNYVEGEEAPIYVSVLSKKDSFWNIQYTIKSIGFGIDHVEVRDMNNDGKKELILGWQGGDIIEKGITVYSLDLASYKEVFQDVYSRFIVGNLNNNSKDELFLIKRNSSKGISYTQMFEYEEDEFVLIDSVKMEGYIDEYYSIAYGKASEDQVGIFIDASIGDRSAFTDLIIYDQDRLKNVFYNNTSESTTKTFKTRLIESKDIDGDGIIEIATLRPSVRNTANNQGDNPDWIKIWSKWNQADGLNKVFETYEDLYNSYRFIFPESWDENIGVRSSEFNDVSTYARFYYLLPKSKEEIQILEIYSLDVNDWSNQSLDIDYSKKYVELGKKYNRIFLAYINEEYKNSEVPPLDIDIDRVKNNFKIINLERDGGN